MNRLLVGKKNESKAPGSGGQLAEHACHQLHSDLLARAISRCINVCHVSRSVSAGTGGPDGILNATFHVVTFSRLVHPSLLCHLLPSQSAVEAGVTAPDLYARASPAVYITVCTRTRPPTQL